MTLNEVPGYKLQGQHLFNLKKLPRVFLGILENPWEKRNSPIRSSKIRKMEGSEGFRSQCSVGYSGFFSLQPCKDHGGETCRETKTAMVRL